MWHHRQWQNDDKSSAICILYIWFCLLFFIRMTFCSLVYFIVFVGYIYSKALSQPNAWARPLFTHFHSLLICCLMSFFVITGPSCVSFDHSFSVRSCVLCLVVFMLCVRLAQISIIAFVTTRSTMAGYSSTRSYSINLIFGRTTVHMMCVWSTLDPQPIVDTINVTNTLRTPEKRFYYLYLSGLCAIK